jgi:hypothetical protein
MKKLVDSVIKLGNLSRAMKCSWDVLGSIFNWCHEKIYVLVYGCPPATKEMKAFMNEVDEFFTKTSMLTEMCVGIDLRQDESIREDIKSTYVKAIGLSRKISKMPGNKDLVHSFNIHFGVFKELFMRVIALGPEATGARIPPFVVLLTGGTAVGKTTIQRAVARDLLRALGLKIENDEQACKHIYNRNIEQEFWDGYNFQEVCVYDDFGQMKDSANNPNLEFMEVIRTNNTSPFNLHMADLSSKDCTPFTSSIVILSSNTHYLDPKSLTCSDAFRRRIDFAIEMKRNENLELDGRAFSYDYSTYASFDASEKERILSHYQDYKEMMGELTQAMIHHRQKQIAIIKEMNAQSRDESYLYTLDDYLVENGNEEEEIQTVDEEDQDAKSESDISEISQHAEGMGAKWRDWFRFTARAEVHAEQKSDDIEAQGFWEDWTSPRSSAAKKKDVAYRRQGKNMTYDCMVDEHGGNPSLWPRDQIEFMAHQKVSEREMHKTAKISSMFNMIDELLDNSEFIVSFINSYGRRAFRKIVQGEMFNYAFVERHLADIKDTIVKAQAFATIALIFNPCMYDYEGQQIIAAAIRKLQGNTPWRGDEKAKHFFTCCNVFMKPSNGVPGFEDYIYAWYHRSQDYLREHPYMHLFVISGVTFTITRLIMTLLNWMFGMPGLETQLPPLSHAHEGLTLGKWAKHAHECEKCGEIFVHGHIIKMQQTSEKYLHLCKACKRSNVDKIGYNIPELVSSGDPNTSKQQKKVIQLVSSGDPTTKRLDKRVMQSNEGWFSNFFGTNKPANPNKVDKIDKFDNVEVGPGETLDQVLKRERVLGNAQMRIDDNGTQVQTRVVNNCYLLTLIKSNGARIVMRGIFLKGKYLLTVAHLFAFAEMDDTFELTRAGMTTPYMIQASKIAARQCFEMVNGEKRCVDLAIVKFPRQVADHPDITNFFAMKQDHAHFQDFFGCLVFNAASDYKRFAYGPVRQHNREVHYADPNRKIYVALQSYEYSLETQAGDCGSPLFVVSRNAARKFIGIHVAGSIGRGFATPVWRELIDDTMDTMPDATAQMDITFPDLEGFVDEDRTDYTVPEGVFMPLGKIKVKPGASTTSKLRPSPLFHELPWMNTMLPAALKPGYLEQPDGQNLWLDPMAIGLKKAGVMCTDIDPILVKVASSDFQRFMEYGTREELRRVLNEDEMIRGIDGENFMPAIRRSTSPGYPWSLNTEGKPGKQKWLGSDEMFIYHPDLKKAVDERERLAKQGKRMACFWVDTLKDERRPIEKVCAGKTRVFSAGPMDFTLLFRKYFLGICGHLEENRIDNEICVGTNVYSYDWQRIADKVTKFGKETLVAGDFSNYDGTLQIDILEEMIDMINRWYRDSEENQLVRKVLWRDIINSIHIWEDNVYGWTHSQPSGCPMTAVLNSIYNSLSVRIVYLLLAPYHMCNMIDFHRNVTMVSYGDDNLIGISPRIVEWFNQLTMAKAYEDIGMTYTDETKSGTMKPYRPLSEVGFLKRDFRYEQYCGRFVAPLSMTTIREMVLWIRGDDNVLTKTAENVQTALFEAALHGEQTYTYMYNALVPVCLSLRIPIQTATWIEQIGSRLAGLLGIIVEESEYEDDNNAACPGLQDTQYSIKTEALGDVQMTEGMSRLDLGEFSLLQEYLAEQQLVGDLFRLDGGRPPTETLGSHPVYESAHVVHNAQSRIERTNKDQQNQDGKVENPPEEVFSNEVKSPVLDVTPGSITQNTKPHKVDDFANEGPSQMEMFSNSIARHLRREVLMRNLTQNDMPFTDSFTLGDFLAKPTVASLLTKFQKFKGTFCCRVEAASSALDQMYGYCGYTFGAAPATFEEVMHKRCSDFDTQKDNSITMKIPIGTLNEYVDTFTPGTSVNPRFFIRLVNILSATTMPSYQLKIHAWIEDAIVAIPKAQVLIQHPPDSTSESSSELFRQRIGEDEIDTLLSEKVSVSYFNLTAASVGKIEEIVTSDAMWPAGSPQAIALSTVRQGSFGYYEFLLKARKTPLHRGRVRITCTGKPANMDQALQVHSVVWDLATDDSFVFQVPFNFYGSYQPFTAAVGPAFYPNIEFFIESALIAPDTVSDTVIVDIFAGIEGFKFLDLTSEAVLATPFEEIHEAQGLIIETKTPPYRFPLQANTGTQKGLTLRQMMGRCLHNSVTYINAAATNNAFMIQPRTDVGTGLLPLLNFFHAWCGSIEMDLHLGAAVYHTDINVGRPFCGAMMIGRDELQLAVPKYDELTGLIGQIHTTSLNMGEPIQFVISPFEGELGAIKNNDLVPGSFVAMCSPSVGFPEVFLNMRLGKDFKAGIRY